MSLEIRFHPEHEITGALSEALRALLAEAFPPAYQERPFFKQLPHGRFVAHREGQVVGHLGLDHRVMHVAGRLVRVFGVVDLCIAADARGAGIGSAMLQAFLTLGEAAGAEYALALADDHGVYLRAGFTLSPVTEATILAIHQDRSHSLMTKDLSDIFMVRPLGAAPPWPAGPVDFMGYLY